MRLRGPGPAATPWLVSFPRSLEVVPPGAPLSSSITLPGSKSVTNRALTLAALAAGTVTLRGALWSEDVELMVGALRALGYSVAVQREVGEPGNRTLVVEGRGGDIPAGGSAADPLEIFVGLAGTTARFLTAMLCLGRGVYRLRGTPAMHDRPQGALFQALRELGYRLDSDHERLPVTIHGSGPRRASCAVSIAESSQFASALLLCAERGGWDVSILNPGKQPTSYIEMTRELVADFPHEGGHFAIEADASGGSYFQAARFLLAESDIAISGWPTTTWQIDARFPEFLPLPASVSRRTDLADSIMTAIVVAPLGDHPVAFTDLGRLRVQECERVVALRTGLTRCGARVEEVGDTLIVHPSPLHGARIDCYGDHRVAMCFATLGLVVPGIVLLEPECVKKTFPHFFAKLAAPPPHGLGVAVRGEDGAPLEPEQLVVR